MANDWRNNMQPKQVKRKIWNDNKSPYGDKIKLNVVAELKEGKKPAAIAKKYKVDLKTVRSWGNRDNTGYNYE